MTQVLIVEQSALELKRVVEGYLKKGWHVVPSTIGCGTTERAARQTELADHTPDGVVFQPHYWAVVERDVTSTPVSE